MNRFIPKLFMLVLLCGPGVQAVALEQQTLDVKTAYAGQAHAVTKASQQGLYRVSLYSSEAPIPLKKIHAWHLHIETAAGVPVENATVTVFGGMPMHQHGFPTKPRVIAYLGKGDYMVEGIKFSMPGYWEMRFNIKQDNKRDRAVFEINLDY